MLSGGAGIASKDLADGLSGAIFKSYYMIPSRLPRSPFSRMAAMCF
jgi:hypothetical protein